MANVGDRITSLEQQVSNVLTKMDMFIAELRDFKTETRQQNEMRAMEIAELRKKDDAMNARIDEKFSKIDEKFEKILTQIQNMAIATVVGVGAIVWAIVSAMKN